MRRPIALSVVAAALIATLTAAAPATAERSRGTDCMQPSVYTDRALMDRAGTGTSVVYRLPGGSFEVTAQTDPMRAGYAAERGTVVLVCFRR